MGSNSNQGRQRNFQREDVLLVWVSSDTASKCEETDLRPAATKSSATPGCLDTSVITHPHARTRTRTHMRTDVNMGRKVQYGIVSEDL